MRFDENDVGKNKNNLVKEKILIVCPCLQDISIVQQNIVFACQFIGALKEHYDILILTSRDTFKFIVSQDVKVIVDFVSVKTIANVLKNEKITKIIPLECSLIMIQKLSEICKIENLFSSYYGGYLSVKFFNKLAMQAGFVLDKKNKKDNLQEGSIIYVIAMKDGFDNQVILDCVSVYKNNGKEILSNIQHINVDLFKQTMQLVKNFGELLKIKNYLYTIKIRVVGNKIIFDKIIYGLNRATIFVIQRQQINIPKIILASIRKQLLYHKVCQDTCAVSCYNEDCFILHFCKNYCDITKNHSFSSNYPLFLQIDNGLTMMKSDEYIAYGEYILVYFEEEYIKDINNQLLFVRICDAISKESEKKIILLTKSLLPSFQLLDEYDVALYANLNDDVLNEIFAKYKITSAYFIQNRKNEILLKLCNKYKIKVYGSNNNKFDLFTNNFEVIDLCNQVGCLYQAESFDIRDVFINFVCIVDCSKNILYKNIVSRDFDGSIGVECYCVPVKTINYNLPEEIEDNAIKIIDRLNFSGMLNISFLYSKGDVFVNDISFNEASFNLLFFQGEIDVFFKVLIKSISGKQIDNEMLIKERKRVIPQFYQKICFKHFDGQFLEFEDTTKEKIFRKYNRMFKQKKGC